MKKKSIFNRMFNWRANKNSQLDPVNVNDAEKQYNDVLDKIYKEIASAVLPVVAGRQTIPDHKSILDVLGEMILVSPSFEVEWIGVIENMAMWDSDVSAAVDNISLANTKLTTRFDEKVSDSLAKEMMQNLNESRNKWYAYADGLNGWIDDSMAQCAVSGAISHEILPTQSIDGIAEIVMVSPKNIFFKYDPVLRKHVPVQKIPQTTIWTGKSILGTYKPLNQVTYRYLAMRRIGESPYAVPPFLSALEGVKIKKDMVSNMKTIIEKIGAYGFLKVMLNAPIRIQGETNDEYQERLRNEINNNSEVVKRGMNSGFMIGFDKLQNIEMQKTDNNVDGATVLTKINDTNTIQGLKQHLELMNRQGSTSETFGRVILAKMGKQLGKYQKLTATALDYIDLFHLQLQGYPVLNVINEFEPVMLGDKEREAKAKTSVISNARQLWADGVYSKQRYAQEVGVESPDMEEEEVRFEIKPSGGAAAQDGVDPSNASADQNPSKGKTTEKNSYKVELPSNYQTLLEQEPEHGMGYHKVKLFTKRGVFDDVIVTNGTYAWVNKLITPNEITLVEVKKKSDVVTSLENKLSGNIERYYSYGDTGHTHTHNESFGVPDDEEHLWANYNLAIVKKWNKTVKVIQKAIAERLTELGPNISLEGITSSIVYEIYSQVDKTFLPDIEPVINKHVRDIYEYYRKSKRPWEGVTSGKDLPDAIFNLTDIRAMQFFERSDNVYLGKFVTDPDTKVKITEYIKKWYLDNDREIGNSPKAIKQFQEAFPDVLNGESWKIRRIIDTTVNRMRNTGAIAFMEQAEVTEFKVLSLNDGVSCSYCSALNGKTMLVKTEYSRIQRIIESTPDALPYISPFVTSLGIKSDDIKQITGVTLQEMGVGMPSYHPHCRCTVVMAD
jgi:hypothetical protein